MKNFSDFEDKLLDSEELMKKVTKTAIDNMGKLIAAVVAIVMIAVTFTDISFTGFITEEFLGTLLLLMTSSYIIYFSLEDAGERSGTETEEYMRAKDRYDNVRSLIKGEDIESLRAFCKSYAEREAQSRKNSILFSHGLSLKSIEEYKNGKKFDKKSLKALRRAQRIKPANLNVKTLLSRERDSGRSELENPDKRKIPILLLKMIPSTICMTVTVSVMLSAKDGMTLSDVLNGILKLSALPIIGFRGYSAGYSYSKHSLSLWMETKANIIEAYISNGVK